VILGLGATHASAALVDYVGFGWEVGGLAPSSPGDELAVAAVGVSIDPIFGATPSDEVTIYIYDLVSMGEFVDPSTGTTTTMYSGGMLDLYADDSPDYDWGINPANATTPSTFTDGELLFRGAFTSFTLFLSTSGAGVFEGMLDGVAGSALAGVCSDCAYSFSGVFTRAIGAQIPEGYDLQIDGSLDVDSTVPVAQSDSFGGIKSLYQNR
jgi:hypothetical protein